MTTAQAPLQTYRSADGLDLAYADQGPSGDPAALVCLAGMTRNGRDFAAFAAARPDRRVLRPDLRGRGASAWASDPLSYGHATYVDDIAALLDAASVQRAVLIGASMGGIVGLRAAHALGERVAGLVLVDVGPDPEAGDPARLGAFLQHPLTAASWAEAADLVRARRAADFPGYGAADWLAMARRLCRERTDGTIVADYDPALAVPFMTPGAIEPWDRWAAFATLDKPMLAVRGALSTLLTAQTLQAMHEANPRLISVEAPEVGHHPDLTEPAAALGVDFFLEGL